jgi:sugar O-acyltransferase (sialic acid O-acetyltransferase NeuD family)
VKRDLVLYGTGGLGREALEIAEAMNDRTPVWNILGFLDDATLQHDTEVNGYPVLGDRAWLADHPADVVVCLGQTYVRRKVVLDLHNRYRARFATLIHPASVVARRSSVGAGSVVFPGVVIGTQSRIGDHAVVSRNAAVGHDIEVRDYVNIFPTACVSGHSVIGEGCEIGSNVTVIPKVKIGDWSVVGAGAVVVRDLPGNVVAVGTPARATKTREDGWHLQ